MRDLVFRVVRLMRWWQFDHKRGVWRHRHHPDVSVSSELLCVLLIHTIAIAAADALETEEVVRDVVT